MVWDTSTRQRGHRQREPLWLCDSASSAPDISVRPTPRVWQNWATRSSATTSTRPRSSCCAPARCRSSSPSLPELLTKQVESGRLALHHRHRRGGRVRRRPLHLCGHPAAERRVRRRPHVRPRGTRVAGAPTHPRRLVVGKSTVPSGTAALLATRLAELAPGGDERRTRLEPRVLARRLRGQRHVAPRATGHRCRVSAGREDSARGMGAADRRRHPADRHRLRDCRTREGGRELLPGDENLVHQRDGRDLRDHRRRRHPASRGAGPRHPHRWPVLARRPRLRRRLPAEGHPRVHGAGRRTGRRPSSRIPA